MERCDTSGGAPATRRAGRRYVGAPRRRGRGAAAAAAARGGGFAAAAGDGGAAGAAAASGWSSDEAFSSWSRLAIVSASDLGRARAAAAPPLVGPRCGSAGFLARASWRFASAFSWACQSRSAPASDLRRAAAGGFGGGAALFVEPKTGILVTSKAADAWYAVNGAIKLNLHTATH